MLVDGSLVRYSGLSSEKSINYSDELFFSANMYLQMYRDQLIEANT